MSLFQCPVCKKQLVLQNKSYVCETGHQFDMAKAGYVNLLQSQSSKSKQHGDDAKMIQARTQFLNDGYYDIFREALKDIVTKYSANSLADVGCGEGWYAEPLLQQEKTIYGIDISKQAVTSAAKRNKNMKLAVASTAKLPLMDSAFDLAYSIFAPFSSDEVYRVLKNDGHFVVVFPLEKHLWGLKSILYDKPYENEVVLPTYEGFELETLIRVEHTIHLTGQTTINNLLAMTPYYHRTPKHAIATLEALETLSTPIQFGFAIYKKKCDVA